jgi:hypothetical protein
MTQPIPQIMTVVCPQDDDESPFGWREPDTDDQEQQ